MRGALLPDICDKYNTKKFRNGVNLQYVMIPILYASNRYEWCLPKCFAIWHISTSQTKCNGIFVTLMNY